MLAHPRLRALHHAEVVDAETVLLVSEVGEAVLHGRLYALVVPLLDGARTADEIADLLDGSAAVAEVFYALELLEQRGYLATDGDGLDPGPAAFWESLGVDPGAAARRLAAAAVSVAAAGRRGAGAIREALGAVGVRVASEGELAIVVTDGYLDGALAAHNEAALASGRPWMLVKPSGARAWIGPIFRPGSTGCWECLAARLRSHRRVEEAVRARRAGASFALPCASLPGSEEAAARLAAIEVAKWIVTGGARLSGRLVTLDTLRFALEDHVLVRRPQCPACGERTGAPGAIAPVILGNPAKGSTTDGGHRRDPPERTFAAYEHHVSAITGVVPALRRAWRGAEGVVHSYVSGPNTALRPALSRGGGLEQSGGKGKSDAQARASALCEALERYSVSFHGDEPRRRARAAELGGAAIHPNACLGFSEAQYRARLADPVERRWPLRVPEPFDESAAVDWTPLWSLTRAEPRYLPTAYCYIGAPIEHGRRFCWPDTNGCAAGTCLEEAILQGFLELVERDGVSVWWHNRVPRPAVDLASLDDPYLRALEQLYRELGREIWVLDVTNDLGVPTFVAASRRLDAEREDILLGFGAHLDPAIGVARALTEMSQSLQLAHPAEGGIRGAVEVDPDLRGWWGSATLASHPYLAPDRATGPRPAAALPRLAGDDLGEDVRRCVAISEARGLETLVLDLTRPDVGLRVVRVVVPGLRHFWRRLAPGRLYDVPVRMGWLPAPLAENALNPLSVFL